MATYEVLRPVEYNGKLYLPKSQAEAPERAKSAGNGADIPVDDSGTIDLDPKTAAQFDLGQVIPVKTKSKVESQESKAKK